MNNPSMPISDPYLVRPGDTLGRIAARAGTSVRELQHLNGLPHPDRLQAGQTLYLSARTAFGVSAVFLDALRHPIRNLEFRCDYDGKSITGVTDATGTIPCQITRSAQSMIAISVRTLEGSWVTLSEKFSGYGHRLLSFVSDAVVVDGQTEAHPSGAPAVQASPRAHALKPSPTQPTLPTGAQGDASRNNPAILKRPKQGAQGQPVIALDIDLPPDLLALFGNYRGGDIGTDDWKQIAEQLGCEPAVLQAIARVESGGRESFWRLNGGNGAHVPALVFERHYFSRLTGRKFDASHPDLSWRTGYRKNSLLDNTDHRMHDGRIDDDDVYGNYARGYLRLINAYRLDPEAALKSCSWGKFQIMGANYTLCESPTIRLFAQDMCKSEATQIALMSAFIRKKPRAWKDPNDKSLGKEISLWDAVKTKNWGAIAFNYNGPNYRTYRYDEKLRAAYMTYSTR